MDDIFDASPTVSLLLGFSALCLHQFFILTGQQVTIISRHIQIKPRHVSQNTETQSDSKGERSFLLTKPPTYQEYYKN